MMTDAKGLKDKAEEAQKPADRFQSFFDSLTVGVVLLEENQTISIANKKALDLLKFQEVD